MPNGGRAGRAERYRGLPAGYAAAVSVPSIPLASLGSSGIQASRLALGSWRTYERISRDEGIRVMQAARGAGINFLDDARYNDETGHAPSGPPRTLIVWPGSKHALLTLTTPL